MVHRCIDCNQHFCDTCDGGNDECSDCHVGPICDECMIEHTDCHREEANAEFIADGDRGDYDPNDDYRK